MYYPKIKEQLVYVIKNDDTNRIKIGISDSIGNRAKALEHASGCKLKVLHLSITLRNARDVEQLIHYELREHRYLGEWFNVDDEKAINTTAKFVIDYGKIANQNKVKEPNNEIFQEYKVVGLNKGDIIKNLNLSDYKRIKQGIYADKTGEIYSIKYRIEGGWLVNKLDKIDD